MAVGSAGSLIMAESKNAAVAQAAGRLHFSEDDRKNRVAEHCPISLDLAAPARRPIRVLAAATTRA
jgi:hypothetical protein